MQNYDASVILLNVDCAVGPVSREIILKSHHDNESLAIKAESEISSGIFSLQTSEKNLTRCGDGRLPREKNVGLQVFGATPGIIKTEIIAGHISSNKPLNIIIRDKVWDRLSIGKKSGAHRADTHGDSKLCGCGECDNAENELENYLKNESELKPLIIELWNAVGIIDIVGDFDESLYVEVIANMRILTDKKFFENGVEQVNAVSVAAGENSIEYLAGEHKEVLWVINLKKGTKFAIEKFNQEFDSFQEEGKGIGAFWEDQWAINEEILTSHSNNERDLKISFLADLIRRVATGMNLTAGNQRIIILK